MTKFVFDDKTGKRFGRLVAKEYVGKSTWLCVCDCGNECHVTSGNLSQGQIKSCGCLGMESRFRPKYDLAGQTFGRLTAEEYVGGGKWRCTCECGNSIIVITNSLISGKTQSCGCLQKDRASVSNTTHGISKAGAYRRLYDVWKGMRQRCRNPKHSAYKNYGGRGIDVCDEWDDFEKFFEWSVSNGYDPQAKSGECTIDRIDNDRNYEPSNCRWVSRAVQARNKRDVDEQALRRRAVELIDEDGAVVKLFESISEAARETGCRTSSITSVCRGRWSTTNGMRWRYA